jgi:hypothetical protein
MTEDRAARGARAFVVRCQESDVRRQKTEDRAPRGARLCVRGTEDSYGVRRLAAALHIGGQESDVGCQESEDRGQKTEDRAPRGARLCRRMSGIRCQMSGIG